MLVFFFSCIQCSKYVNKQSDQRKEPAVRFGHESHFFFFIDPQVTTESTRNKYWSHEHETKSHRNGKQVARYTGRFIIFYTIYRAAGLFLNGRKQREQAGVRFSSEGTPPSPARTRHIQHLQGRTRHDNQQLDQNVYKTVISVLFSCVSSSWASILQKPWVDNSAGKRQIKKGGGGFSHRRQWGPSSLCTGWRRRCLLSNEPASRYPPAGEKHGELQQTYWSSLGLNHIH